MQKLLFVLFLFPVLLLGGCVASSCPSGLWVEAYQDADLDGFGAPGTRSEVCDGEEGWAPGALDCDDTNAATHPSAEEVCDGVDQNCDGIADNGPGMFVYPDADRDGWGRTAEPQPGCLPGPGWASQPDDCADGDAAIHPGATEACNDLDDDCDGVVDEDAPPDRTWFEDRDGDGFGDDGSTQQACTPPPRQVGPARGCAAAQTSGGLPLLALLALGGRRRRRRARIVAGRPFTPT